MLAVTLLAACGSSGHETAPPSVLDPSSIATMAGIGAVDEDVLLEEKTERHPPVDECGSYQTSLVDPFVTSRGTHYSPTHDEAAALQIVLDHLGDSKPSASAKRRRRSPEAGVRLVSLDLEHVELTLEQVSSLATILRSDTRFSDLEALRLPSNGQVPLDDLQDILESLPNLTHLFFINPAVNDDIVRAIAANCTHLRVVALGGGGVTNNSAFAVFRSYAPITHLRLDGSFDYAVLPSFCRTVSTDEPRYAAKHLETLSLDFYRKPLKALNLSSLDSITKAKMWGAKLSVLQLGITQEVFDADFRHIGRSPLYLKLLHFPRVTVNDDIASILRPQLEAVECLQAINTSLVYQDDPSGHIPLSMLFDPSVPTDADILLSLPSVQAGADILLSLPSAQAGADLLLSLRGQAR